MTKTYKAIIVCKAFNARISMHCGLKIDTYVHSKIELESKFYFYNSKQKSPPQCETVVNHLFQ